MHPGATREQWQVHQQPGAVLQAHPLPGAAVHRTTAGLLTTRPAGPRQVHPPSQEAATVLPERQEAATTPQVLQETVTTPQVLQGAATTPQALQETVTTPQVPTTEALPTVQAVLHPLRGAGATVEVHPHHTLPADSPAEAPDTDS